MMRWLVCLAFVAACGGATSRAAEPLPKVPPGAEAVSMLGAPLVRPELDEDELRKREAALAEAQAAVDKAPDDVDAAIWLGRRLGYLNRFRDAVAVFTAAIAAHPDDARLYRHRGHRYLTLRLIDRAIADLERAAALRAKLPDEVEPDGMPNPAGIPTSTLHGNIWYHLGLAHYLRGDLAAAERAYQEALRVATTDDSRVAAAYWLYLTLRRQDRLPDANAMLAELPARPEVLDNASYLTLIRLFRGETTIDAIFADLERDRITTDYGVAIFRQLQGDEAAGLAELRMLAADPAWPSFGRLAAESELARLWR